MGLLDNLRKMVQKEPPRPLPGMPGYQPRVPGYLRPVGETEREQPPRSGEDDGYASTTHVDLPRVVDDQAAARPRQVDPATLRNAEFEERVEALLSPADEPTLFTDLDAIFGPPAVVHGPTACAQWRTAEGAVEVRCPFSDGRWRPWLKPYSQAALHTWRDRVWFDARYGEIASASYLWSFTPVSAQPTDDEGFAVALAADDWDEARLALEPISRSIISDLRLLPPHWGLATIVVSAEREGVGARLWFNRDVLQVVLPEQGGDRMILDPTDADAAECVQDWLSWLEAQHAYPPAYSMVVDVDLATFAITPFRPRP